MSDQRPKTGSSHDEEYQRLIGDTLSELDSKLAEPEISGEILIEGNKLIIHWATVVCFFFALCSTLSFLYLQSGVVSDDISFQEANEILRTDLQSSPQTDRGKLVANAVIDFTAGLREMEGQEASKLGELYSALQKQLLLTGEDEELLQVILLSKQTD